MKTLPKLVETRRHRIFKSAQLTPPTPCGCSPDMRTWMWQLVQCNTPSIVVSCIGARHISSLTLGQAEIKKLHRPTRH
eukprot:scaffold122904_cov30-Tisochrysis_lutea.AAC.2